MTSDQDNTWNLPEVLPSSLPPVINMQRSGAGTIERDLEEQSILELLHVCGPNAREIFKRAIGLARNLNHKEVEISHVLLSMTLNPNGLRQLNERKASPDTVLAARKACWETLQQPVPLGQTAPAVAFSNEVTEFIEIAKDRARAQGDTEYTIRVTQLVDAIMNHKFDGYFDKSVVKITDVMSRVDAIKKDLDRLEPIERRIATIKRTGYAILAISSGVLILVATSWTFPVGP